MYIGGPSSYIYRVDDEKRVSTLMFFSSTEKQVKQNNRAVNLLSFGIMIRRYYLPKNNIFLFLFGFTVIVIENKFILRLIRPRELFDILRIDSLERDYLELSCITLSVIADVNLYPYREWPNSCSNGLIK